jgi:hypothetical protein
MLDSHCIVAVMSVDGPSSMVCHLCVILCVWACTSCHVGVYGVLFGACWFDSLLSWLY